jgi:hypothetical protein
MQVANSTGQNAEFRVTPSAQEPVACSAIDNATGTLEPNTHAYYPPPPARSWLVQFAESGAILAEQVVYDPNALVTLVEGETGGFKILVSQPASKTSAKIQVRPTHFDVFISYSKHDQKWAERLNKTLVASGFSTWLVTERSTLVSSLQRQIEEAVRSTTNIVVLIGPGQEPSEFQRFEWGAALEAVWSDPTKQLIPLLLRGADLPSFVRSAAATGEAIAAIRIENPSNDWDHAVEGLIKVLRHEVAPVDKSELIATAEEDRSQQQERLSYIKKVAASFKP